MKVGIKDMLENLSLDQRMQLHGNNYVETFERTHTPERFDRLIGLIALGKDSVVADFGCGSGQILERIKDKVKLYKGIDFSEEFISAANRRKNDLNAKNAEFVCGSIQEFCDKHLEHFDAGLAFDISEHVNDGEWGEIVNAIYKSLKPGGHVYLHTPNAGFFVEILKARNIVLRQFPEHIAVRNAGENAAFFRSAGFEAVTVRFLPHYNVLKAVRPLAALPALGKYFHARIFIEARKPLADSVKTDGAVDPHP